IGEGVAQGIPIEGVYPMRASIFRYDYAGGELTERLGELLTERGHYDLNVIQNKDIVQDIKEKCCYVASDFDAEMEKTKMDSSLEKIYELPDGQKVTVGSERFRCAEALFQPSMVNLDIPGIHRFVFDSIQRAPIDLRKDFSNNIVLAGGTTMLPGF